ncbi:N-acetyl sugar amidotransferase [Spiribacter roseus]|uniref:N-acetyl sugar amidotransferase n=1 Tax=Spiribacter roseus TaxID=1855875 RepID=UPI0013303D47|nr:N-acetyl sugar amidotransferase [Spiribacter roseus]KAF0282811.1 LPS biosynthesis protein [Spiribacter roseus]
MKYCKVCLTTDLRPNASFDEDDVCIACNYSNDATEPSLSKLSRLQRRIIETRKGLKRKTPYDCIVGVSGGKDSTRQAQWVRDRLGMQPLLVCCAYPPYQMTDAGARNLSNLMNMGFELLILTPAPRSASKLSLASFRHYGNVCKASEMALFSTVPRVAIDTGVNLIFWGENPALQVGDSSVMGVDEFDGNQLRHLNTLTGGAEWLKKELTSPHLSDHYIYPEEYLFNKKKVSIFYLGAAWDDWSSFENASYAALSGLTLRPNEEHITGDISNASMLDEEFTNINMMIKYFKFGFGRTTDLVSEQIRAGRMTREEAIPIVSEFDGVCDDSIINRYCLYVGISYGEFWKIINRYVNSDLFRLQEGKRPIPRFQVGVDFP